MYVANDSVCYKNGDVDFIFGWLGTVTACTLASLIRSVGNWTQNFTVSCIHLQSNQ